MSTQEVIYSNKESGSRLKFQPPDLSPEKWCDFRQEYESGLSLKAIAQIHLCDPRTVRICIIHNRGSQELGRQTAPTKLAPFAEMIDTLLQKYSASEPDCKPSKTLVKRKTGICALSQMITLDLKKIGYSGSERTVRNYLRNKYMIEHKNGKGVASNDPD